MGPGALLVRKFCIEHLDFSSFICFLDADQFVSSCRLLSHVRLWETMWGFIERFALLLKASDDGKTVIFHSSF
jgi:hypothetical protein